MLQPLQFGLTSGQTYCAIPTHGSSHMQHGTYFRRSQHGSFLYSLEQKELSKCEALICQDSILIL